MASSSKKTFTFTRGILPVDGHSPHFGAGLQLIAHTITPLRKAVVHFYLTTRTKTLEIPEWKFLSELGRFFQALIAESEDPLDPSDLYAVLIPMISEKEPKDATQALQSLLEAIQNCTRKVPVTSNLWSTLLDLGGMGLIAKQSIVGKKQESDSEILQRTKKDTCIMWCPLSLEGKYESLEQGIQGMVKTPMAYDWEKKKCDFEVRIPLLSPSQATGDQWVTTKNLSFSTLPAFLFFGLQRFGKDGQPTNREIEIPSVLDVSKYCKGVNKGTKYTLVGGILYDEGDYVAILKNPNPPPPEEAGDEVEDWNLFETEEVIPMSEADVVEFLKGEEEGGVTGTVAVYSTTEPQIHEEMNQVLSDIIISHVSGTINSSVDFYFEEEIIEEVIEE